MTSGTKSTIKRKPDGLAFFKTFLFLPVELGVVYAGRREVKGVFRGIFLNKATFEATPEAQTSPLILPSNLIKWSE